MESKALPQANHHFKRRVSAGLIVAGGLAVGLSAPSWMSSQADTHDDAAAGTQSAPQSNTGVRGLTPIAVHEEARKVTKATAVSAVKQAVGTPGVRVYRVQANDTLSDIARSQLGDASRYQEIFDLNKGKAQHDGGSLSDPDVIQVGWTLQLPAQAAQASPAVSNGVSSAVVAAVMTTSTAPAHPTTGTHTTVKQSAHTTVVASGSPRAIARSIVPSSQFGCFSQIISHESGWDIHATNPSSGAYGLPQSLPGSKMASAGPNWRDDATTQIKWALEYMDSRYGSPCDAWSFWQGHNWY